MMLGVDQLAYAQIFGDEIWIERDSSIQVDSALVLDRQSSRNTSRALAQTARPKDDKKYQ